MNKRAAPPPDESRCVNGDPPLLLVVDDKPENLDVLVGYLERTGLNLRVAMNGHEALGLTRQQPPDLILLDVMMPDIDGFEVCRRLKAQAETRDIPIIFITALRDSEHIVKGLELGGVDYITKPFQQEEVEARIATHLTLARQRAELAARKLALETRNAELDAFVHTVAHDLKNPLNAVSGAMQMIRMVRKTGDTEVDQDELLMMADRLVMKMNDIIEALLLLAGTSKRQALTIEPFDMGYVVGNAEDRLAYTLREYAVELVKPPRWSYVAGYTPWVEEIWCNYITNALKYGGDPPRVELGEEEHADHVRFWVRDNGPGLNPEEQAQLFVPFTRLHTNRAEGHGLGLCIVRQIAAKLHGAAGVESVPGEGSTFYFTLPKQPVAARGAKC